jgi:hypothetical protein
LSQIMIIKAHKLMHKKNPKIMTSFMFMMS